MSEEKRPGGPDLTQDVRPAEFIEGTLLGHVADDEVLPVQVGSEILAILLQPLSRVACRWARG